MAERIARLQLHDLGGKLEIADKEVDDKTAAGAARQKADNERAVAGALAREHFLHLRRVVRRVHGPTSREYHSLRDRTGTASDEPGTTPQP